MKEIKVKFPHYSIELPYDLPLIELARALAHTRLRLTWNITARRLEVKAIHMRKISAWSTYTNGGMEQIVNSSYWDEVDLPL